MSNIITVPSVTGPQKAQLSPAVQNGVGVVYTIAMKKADGTAYDLTGYTVTAVKQGENGATSSLTGALALVTAASGIFSWTLSAEDVGTASTFRVFFSATNGTITIRSYGVEWKVEAHPSATVVAAPGVTGVTVAEAGLLGAILELTGLVKMEDGAAEGITIQSFMETFLAAVDAAAARTAIGALPEDAAIVAVSSGRDLATTDAGKILECTGTFTLTCPNGLDTGFQCAIVNISTGVITLAATTTLTTKDSAVTLANQYGAATVYHAGSNVWRAIGDLS